MKQIISILLLVAVGQYSTNAMDQEQYELEQAAAQRETLAKAAQARLNPQAQPEQYTIASLAGLPIELQEQIALQMLTNSPTLKGGLKNMVTLARSNKQLSRLLTKESFVNKVKELIQQRNQQAELNRLLVDYTIVGNVYAVRLLLKLGADVNTVGSVLIDTVLLIAARKGYTEIVQALLDADANVAAANTFSLTALMLAAKNGHTDIVQALLNAGADVNAVSRTGTTVLEFAHDSKNQEVIKLIQDAIHKS